MGFIGSLEKWLQGKKTYIVAVLVGIVATLGHLGIAIPVWVAPLLGALGLGALKSAISKSTPGV